MKKIALLIFLFIPISLFAQQYHFAATPNSDDSCCISIDAGVINNPNDLTWSVTVDNNRYNSNNTDGSFLHCVTQNGDYVVNFWVDWYSTTNPYWSDTVAITNCDPCDTCNIEIDSLHVIQKIDDLVAFIPIGLSYNSNNCTILSEIYDYGDGTSGPLPYHTYTEPGTYTACYTFSMIAPNGTICSETVCNTVVISDPCDDCAINSGPIDVTYQTPYTVDLVSNFGYNPINCRYVYMKWDLGDGTITSTVEPTHTYSEAGRYDVCVTIGIEHRATGEICLETVCKGVNIGIRPPDDGGSGSSRRLSAPTSNILISPNPATTTTTISFPTSLQETRVEQINVYHISGKQIATHRLLGANAWELDLSHLPAGIYLVQTVDNVGNTQTERLVKAE